MHPAKIRGVVVRVGRSIHLTKRDLRTTAVMLISCYVNFTVGQLVESQLLSQIGLCDWLGQSEVFCVWYRLVISLRTSQSAAMPMAA